MLAVSGVCSEVCYVPDENACELLVRQTSSFKRFLALRRVVRCVDAHVFEMRDNMQTKIIVVRDRIWGL